MKFKLLLLSLSFLSLNAFAKTVRYELVATQQEVNLSGKKTVNFTLLVNGSIPAPVLEFTEGDTAEILVKNRIPNQELSVHWHGILLPNEMDGVPNVTTAPIASGQEFLFKFPIRQHGTYWYHSHTDVQEQKGVFGAIVIHPKKEIIPADKEVVVVLSDWSDEDGLNILKNLRKDGDYYLYKKDTVRSWLGAMQAHSLGTYLGNEWSRMGGMDLSDIGYDAFLINGKRDSQLLMAHPGEKIRIRIINAAASSYFYVSLGQTPMKVISADGIDIEPILAKDILLGMAETYDVLFEVPEHKNFELRATAQDGTGFASGWIGMGPKVFAPVRALPDLYASMNHAGHNMAGMDHSGAHGNSVAEHTDHAAGNTDHTDHASHEPAPSASSSAEDMGDMPGMEHMDHAQHANHPPTKTKSRAKAVEALAKENLVSVESLNVDEIRSATNTELPKSAPVREIKLVLDGNMERYIWYINGKAIFEDRNIEVHEGEALRITFENKTMMHHPMHLHGHFFRVLNKNGSFSPLKHTVDVPPHGERIIEFYANEPGEWMLHCHNLYHMKTGMARIAKYISFTPKPEILAIQKYDHHMHDHWYTYGRVLAASNIGELNLRASQTWNEFDARIEARNDEEWEAEGDLFYRRWVSNYLNFVAGGTALHHDYRGVAGIGYTLPMLIEINALVDHKGKWRLDLDKKFQWTKYLYSEVEYTWREDKNLDSESLFSLMYASTWSWAAGIQYTDRSWGAGLQYRF